MKRDCATRQGFASISSSVLSLFKPLTLADRMRHEGWGDLARRFSIQAREQQKPFAAVARIQVFDCQTAKRQAEATILGARIISDFSEKSKKLMTFTLQRAFIRPSAARRRGHFAIDGEFVDECAGVVPSDGAGGRQHDDELGARGERGGFYGGQPCRRSGALEIFRATALARAPRRSCASRGSGLTGPRSLVRSYYKETPPLAAQVTGWS